MIDTGCHTSYSDVSCIDHIAWSSKGQWVAKVTDWLVHCESKRFSNVSCVEGGKWPHFRHRSFAPKLILEDMSASPRLKVLYKIVQDCRWYIYLLSCSCMRSSCHGSSTETVMTIHLQKNQIKESHCGSCLSTSRYICHELFLLYVLNTGPRVLFLQLYQYNG